MTVPSPTKPSEERRCLVRRRTRLRPVKLVTRGREFLADGSTVDLSDDGARIRHYGKTRIPTSIVLFDEREGTMRSAVVVWRVLDEIGLRFTSTVRPIAKDERLRLGGRYYALS